MLDSLRHPQTNRGLLLHGWCLPLNHLHLMAKALDNDLIDVLRDFKKFTSKQFVAAIEGNLQASRQEWMLRQKL